MVQKADGMAPARLGAVRWTWYCRDACYRQCYRQCYKQCYRQCSSCCFVLLLLLLLLLLLPTPSSQGHSGPIGREQLVFARASANPVDVPTAPSPAPSLLLILTSCSYSTPLLILLPSKAFGHTPVTPRPQLRMACSATKKKRRRAIWRERDSARDSAACSAAVPFRDPTWQCTCHRYGGGASPPRGTCHP